MRAAVQRISNNPAYAKYLNWGKLVTITGSAQIVVQAMGFVSSILIIRLLPTAEYAFYVLANTFLGTMTVLADGGITAGVMAQGAKVWSDRQKLGVVIATGLDLRRKFAVGSLIVATPILIYFLRFHNASWLMTILICLSLIPAFLAALSDGLLEVAPKLKKDIVPLQKNQVFNVVTRLVMIAITLFIFPWTFVAILGNGVARTWANIRLRKISITYADRHQKPDKEVQKNILQTVKRILPGSIYYCVSGQITIWLISIFGSTIALSQVGALGGLTTAFTIFSVMFNTLVVPQFAKLIDDLKILLKNFIVIQAGLIVLGGLIILFVAIFSKSILWVFGHSFAHLTKEVIMVATGGVVALIGGSTNTILSCRNIIVPPAILIPITIAVQVLLAFVLPIKTVVGVLEYGILTSAFAYVFRVFYFFYWTRKHYILAGVTTK